MASETEKDVPQCHVPECKLPIDVVIKTSDEKYFGTHLQSLESYAEGFPPASLGKRKRTNHMDIEEDSEVVSLMLHLMHRQPQPDLRQTPIGVLVRLSEAVEKYLVYSAMSTCRAVMGNRATEAPLQILGYALKHGYHEVADIAAVHSLGESWEEVRKELGSLGVVIWAEYREKFFSLFRNRGLGSIQCLDHDEHEYDICSVAWGQLPVMRELFKSPGKILDRKWKDTYFESSEFAPSGWCKYRLAARLMEMTQAAEGVPPFCTLL